MMKLNRQQPVGVGALLEGDAVRRTRNAVGDARFAAIDIVALFYDPGEAAEMWEQLKQREPLLAEQVEITEFPTGPDHPATTEGLSVEGVFRLVQSIPSGKAERLKKWLAHLARERLVEAQNPELAALRARKLYERKGYSRRWADKRLRGVSARQELTSEWYRRGAAEGEQFRELTNNLMRRSFGMDVEQYRRYKQLSGPAQNLRDHMSDLELALTTLGETTAVALHQARDSKSFEQLRADTEDAGEIVARTRQLIEEQSRQAIVHRGNHVPPKPRRRGRHPGTELADEGKDMHNPSPSHPVRTVA